MQLDERLIQVSLQIGGNIIVLPVELACSFSVTKSTMPTMNEADIKVANLPQELRNELLYKVSPFTRARKRVPITLQVGRKSTGLSTIFVGDVITTSIAPPPDIWTTFKCKSGFWNGGSVIAVSSGNMTDLSKIAADAAKRQGLNLVFEAQNKKIANYTHNGSATKENIKLGEMGGVDVYQDDNRLIVKNKGEPLKNTVKLVNKDTGMIGIPTWDENGLTCKMLIDTYFKCGGGIKVESVINPKINGVYTIYKLVYEGANRDTPWYMTASTMPPQSVWAGNTNV